MGTNDGIWTHLLTGAVAFLLGGATAVLCALLIRRKKREEDSHD